MGRVLTTDGGAHPVVVRPARPNDAAKLAAFFTEAWPQAGPAALGFAGANEGAMGEIAAEEFLRRRISSPVIRTTVAEEGRRLVGFSSVRKVEARKGEVSGVVVLESHTGRGLGTRLLRKSLEAARKQGIDSIVVKTDLRNERAVRFFKKSGFTESGKVAGRLGGSRVELRVLEKRLR